MARPGGCISLRSRWGFALGDEGGSATLNALGYLILVVALAGALAALTLTGTSQRTERLARTEARTEALALALKAAQAAVSGDSVAGALVSDASSALNPNWIRADVLERTPFRDWLLAGRSGTAFAQDRADHGFSAEAAERWADWFRLDLLTHRMSVWGPWPVNAADEGVLQEAYFVRTGDRVAAERFREGIRQARREQKFLTESSLRALAEPHADEVAPLFSAAAPWNVNTLPEDQLRALLAYPPFALPDPSGLATVLINARLARPLRTSDLTALLALPPEHGVFAYLGTVTQVWRIVVELDGESLVSYWLHGEVPLAREWVPESAS